MYLTSLFCGTNLPFRQTTPKYAKKVKSILDSNYSYLGGNALSRDKKGRVTKDDGAFIDMQMAGQTDSADYTAFVYYEFEIQ